MNGRAGRAKRGDSVSAIRCHALRGRWLWQSCKGPALVAEAVALFAECGGSPAGNHVPNLKYSVPRPLRINPHALAVGEATADENPDWLSVPAKPSVSRVRTSRAEFPLHSIRRHFRCEWSLHEGPIVRSPRVDCASARAMD